jgi:photosystem II stability/assembly factor-like uncharacterized protein
MNRRYRIMKLGLLAAALSSAPGLAETATETDYAMLPALENSSPASAVLLDVTNTGERLVAVGERGLVTWSDDQGDSWHQSTVPVSLTLTSVYFANANKGWATGHEGLILSTNDGGLNWEVQQTGRDTVTQSIPLLEAEVARLQVLLDATEDPEEQDVITFDQEYFIFAIEDAQAALENGPNEPLLDIWFKDENIGYAVGSYGAFLATTDGGENWQLKSLSLDNADKYHLNRFTSGADGTLYIVGESGLAFRSGDQGATWEKLPVPYDGSLFGILALEGDALLIYGLRGHIFYSGDKGDNWTEVDSTIQSILVAGAKSNGKVLLVGASGIVLQSNSDGSDMNNRFHPARATFSAVLPLDDSSLLLVGTGGAVKMASYNELESEQL